MAKRSTFFLTDTVEERLARRAIERFSLLAPVDVVSLISKYADFEEVNFPVEIDGVSLHIKSPSRRPVVLVSAGMPKTRKRFTIAHELGHIVIPWHAGSIIDDVSATRSKNTNRYREKEGEANRFAAELLMPYDWVVSELEQAPDFMAGVNGIASKAEVSLEAAALRAQKIGAPDIIIALTSGNRVVRAGRTHGTRANVPQIGSKFAVEMVYPHKQYSSSQCSAGTFHAWELATEHIVPKKPKQESKEILDQIFNDLDIADDRSTRASIHGIISVANGSVRTDRTRERVYSAILHNITNRQDSNKKIKSVLSHPKFSEFVTARSYEFKL